MAWVAGDWTITRSTGAIRYIGADHAGAASYVTAIDFHRELQAFADDASSSGDDELAIYDEDPSARSTDNIIRLKGLYNIDDNAAEHIYDGSIIQGTGGTEVIYDGIVNYGNADVQIQIHQNGAVLADDWWNLAGAGLNPDAAQGISHRFMVKVRDSGADIDGRRLLGTARRFNYTYQEFPINGTSRGNNVFALADAADLNNETAEGTVSGWTGIVVTTNGYVGIDVNNDTTDEFYYVEWNANTPTRSINDFYERHKWLTREGSASTIHGLNGELFRGITHELTVDTPTGTFNAQEPVSWTGGTGQMLAINSPTAATKMWIQLLTGVVPTDGQVITGGTSSATVALNVTVTPRTINKPAVGASTGSAIIGGYGLGLNTDDLTAADKLFDLTNTQILPPNNVTFSVGPGLVASEDRVLVAPWDGSTVDNEGFPAIEVDQFTLNTTLSGATETAVVLTTTIPNDTPSTGTIRIQLDTGNYRLQSYTSWSGSTFTIPSTSYTGVNVATQPRNVYISYIDKLAGAATESFTGVYVSDRNLVVIVRDGGGTPIKQFISAATLTSTGGSATPIRTSDT